jgi:spermidine synthase
MSQSGAIGLDGLRARSAVGALAPITIFLGAFLLFAVEPLIAKMILPWFGGSAEVWIVCLLFFQTALLAGYLYAHCVSYVKPPWRLRLHVVVLAASLLFLPIIPSDAWKPAGGETPLFHILGVLASTIGLPFVLLAANGPLVQHWLSPTRTAENGRSVYRLYALSNAGSLLALLLYPVAIEPLLATRLQAWCWSLAYAGFAVLCVATLWGRRDETAGAERAERGEPKPSIAAYAGWFVLPLFSSALLLAATNYILRNIAAIPLFWIVPLALYLLSFIVAFDSPRWYYRPLWYPLFAASAGLMIYFMDSSPGGTYVPELLLYSGGVFVCCLVCHGELAAWKPQPAFLTLFYLIIAAGGAAGGVLIAAVAPAVLDSDYDLALILPLLSLLVIAIAWQRGPATLPNWLRWNALACALYLWAYVTGAMLIQARTGEAGTLVAARNFYGPLRVGMHATPAAKGEVIQLWNGNIIHGREYLFPDNRCEPISYYSPQSGIGVVLRELGKQGPLNVGVIGLGAGMVAGYGRTEDVFRFYEINPLVYKIATGSFFYLSSCPAQWTVAIGDARLSLEREQAQGFDVLAVDAFTSDAIPVHLLTKEAFALYWRHLKPDGVLAVHVSNRYVDLAPIVALAAEEFGKTARRWASVDDPANAVDGSTWVLVTSSKKLLENPPLAGAGRVDAARLTRPWTDDYSDVWSVLR